MRGVLGTSQDNFHAQVSTGGDVIIGGLAVRTGGFTLNTSNELVANSQGVNLAVEPDTQYTNVSVSAQITLANQTSSHAGVIARYAGQDDEDMYLGALVRIGSSYSVEIWRNVGGTWTQLSAVGVSVSSGLVELSITDDVLQLSLDGEVVSTVTDSALQGAASVGIRGSLGTSFGQFAAQ